MGPTGGLLPVKPLSSGGEIASRPSHRADSGASLWEPSAASASIMAAWRLWGGVPARVGPQGHGAWGSTHILGTSARVGLTQSNTSTIPCVSLRTRMGQRAAHRKQTPPYPPRMLISSPASAVIPRSRVGTGGRTACVMPAVRPSRSNRPRSHPILYPSPGTCPRGPDDR
jgi:hypothetical protein